MKIILKDKTEFSVTAFTSYEHPEEIVNGVNYFVELDYKGIDNLQDYIESVDKAFHKKGNIKSVKFVDNEGIAIPMKFSDVGFIHFGMLGTNNKFIIRIKLIP